MTMKELMVNQALFELFVLSLFHLQQNSSQLPAMRVS
jgi:hypothetical protein